MRKVLLIVIAVFFLALPVMAKLVVTEIPVGGSMMRLTDHEIADLKTQICNPPPPPPVVPGGTLKVGDTYRVPVDGFRGKEDQTEPIPEKDNPEWERHNVKRAYKSGRSYWYTSRRHGKGYVDVMPDFGKLGEGEYEITTYVRMTRNRAEYEAEYEIHRADGSYETIFRFKQYSADARWVTLDLPIVTLSAGDFLRMADNKGSSSVCFSEVKFKRIS